MAKLWVAPPATLLPESRNQAKVAKLFWDLKSMPQSVLERGSTGPQRGTPQSTLAENQHV
jgi:hypothetical protein